MKENIKRYFLVEYVRPLVSVYNTYEDYSQALLRIDKYNQSESVKKAPFIYGNLTTQRGAKGEYILTTHLYHKLTERCDLKDLDKFTSNFNEDELIIKMLFPETLDSKVNGIRFRDKIMSLDGTYYTNGKTMYPDISIAYFMDEKEDNKNRIEVTTKDKKGKDKKVKVSTFKKIKYLPVMYKDDVPFMKRDIVKNALLERSSSKDVKFFRGLIEVFNLTHDSDKELDNLERSIDRVKYQDNPGLYKWKHGKHVYDENGYMKTDYRRKRDFGMYIRNYEAKLFKDPNNYSYNSVSSRKLKTLLNKMKAENVTMVVENNKLTLKRNN